MNDDVMIPCDQALLAGTLALMTAYSRPLGETAEPGRLSELGQRHLLARKITSNLFFLREHPTLGEGLRNVITKVHHHWQQILAESSLPRPQSGTDLESPRVRTASIVASAPNGGNVH